MFNIEGESTMQNELPFWKTAYFKISLIFALWLSMEYWALGPLSLIYTYGNSLETIPVYLGLIHSKSTVTLWTPFIAGGLDRLAFWGNSDPLSLELFLFSIFPSWLANGIHMFLQRFIAIYFTARLCEEQLGMNKWQSILTGLLHGVLSFYVVGFLMTSPSLPFILWWIYRIRNRNNRILISILSGIGFSILTSASQGILYLIPVIFGWFILIKNEWSKNLFQVLSFFSLTLFIVKLPSILALLYQASSSQRYFWQPTFAYNRFLYEFDLFDRGMYPWITSGILAVIILPSVVILIIYLLTSSKSIKNNPELGLYLRLSVTLLVLRSNLISIIMFGLGSIIHGLSGINFDRFLYVSSPLIVSILITTAAYLVFPLIKEMETASKYASIITSICLIILISKVQHQSLAYEIIFCSLLILVLLGQWLSNPGVLKIGFLALVVCLSIYPKVFLFYPLSIGWGVQNYDIKAYKELKQADTGLFRVASVMPLQPTYAYASGFETVDGWSNLYPNIYRNFWLKILEPYFTQFPSGKTVFDPPGKSKPQDHYIFLGLGEVREDENVPPYQTDFDARFRMNLLSIMNTKYIFSLRPLTSKYLKLIESPVIPPTSLEAPDYASGFIWGNWSARENWSILNRADKYESDILNSFKQRLEGNKPVYIYENICNIPRYHFVTQINILDNDEQILSQMSQTSPAELYKTAWIIDNRSYGTFDKTNLSPGDVYVDIYSPDRIKLHVKNTGDGYLVIANTWNPYWTAEVDGKPRELIRTNYIQYGLPVFSGESEIDLRYMPPYGLWYNFSSLIEQNFVINISRQNHELEYLGVFSNDKVCDIQN